MHAPYFIKKAALGTSSTFRTSSQPAGLRLFRPHTSRSRSGGNCTWETTEQADQNEPEPHWWAARVGNDHFQEKGGLESQDERGRKTERDRELGENNGLRLSCSAVSDSCDPRGRSPPGSSVHGILQAGILEWAAISFSRASSWPRGRTRALLHRQAGSLPPVPCGNSSVETRRFLRGGSAQAQGGSNSALEVYDCSSGPVLDPIFSLLQHLPDSILPRLEETSPFPCPIHPVQFGSQQTEALSFDLTSNLRVDRFSYS